VNYEQIRAAIADAVMIGLPVDPAPPHQTLTHFVYSGPTTADTTPVWGPPEELVETITTGVMKVLFPDPVWPPRQPVAQAEELLGMPTQGSGQWGCRCDATKCTLKWDIFRDASTDPSAVVRVTCLTHGISGSSEPARVADNLGPRQRAQAMYRLDLAHQEQCR